MSEDMVFRVARALATADAAAVEAEIEPTSLSWAECLAVAAINTMREPTQAMIDAGMKEAETDLASEYRAMIDAALQSDRGR